MHLILIVVTVKNVGVDVYLSIADRDAMVQRQRWNGGKMADVEGIDGEKEGGEKESVGPWD